MNRFQTSSRLILSALLFLLFFTYTVGFTQELVQDTLIILLSNFDTSLSTVVIDSVYDSRDEYPCFLGRYEVNKYWFIPVDLLILADQPLTENISNSFLNPGTEKTTQLELIIDHFKIAKNENSFFYPYYSLNASIHLNRIISKDSVEYIGSLLYEHIDGVPFFGGEMKDDFESLYKSWQQIFINDLSSISDSNIKKELSNLFNFRSSVNKVKNTNMHIGTDCIITPGDILVDAEIFFSNREANQFFFRSGYGIRYRNSDKSESIEFGISVDYLFYRLSQSLIFKLKSQLLLGVNRWKDYKSNEHKLYDMFIGDISLSQSLLLDPLDKSSFIIGLGISENFSYIYSRDLKVKIGLLVHLGFKL